MKIQCNILYMEQKNHLQNLCTFERAVSGEKLDKFKI